MPEPKDKAAEYGIDDNFEDLTPETFPEGRIAYTQSGKLIKVIKWSEVGEEDANLKLLMWASGDLDDVSTYPEPDDENCQELDIKITLGLEKGWIFPEDSGDEEGEDDPDKEEDAKEPKAEQVEPETDGDEDEEYTGKVTGFSVGLPELPAGWGDDDDAPLPDPPDDPIEDEPPVVIDRELNETFPSYHQKTPPPDGTFYPGPVGGLSTQKVTVTLALELSQLGKLEEVLRQTGWGE